MTSLSLIPHRHSKSATQLLQSLLHNDDILIIWETLLCHSHFCVIHLPKVCMSCCPNLLLKLKNESNWACYRALSCPALSYLHNKWVQQVSELVGLLVFNLYVQRRRLTIRLSFVHKSRPLVLCSQTLQFLHSQALKIPNNRKLTCFTSLTAAAKSLLSSLPITGGCLCFCKTNEFSSKNFRSVLCFVWIKHLLSGSFVLLH